MRNINNKPVYRCGEGVLVTHGTMCDAVGTVIDVDMQYNIRWDTFEWYYRVSFKDASYAPFSLTYLPENMIRRL